jgi:glutamate receptor, ionotropic, invertebrate
LFHAFVAGIFHEDNYEAEIAFRTAVERVNIHEKAFKFEPLIHHVSPDDSFRTEKIGD